MLGTILPQEVITVDVQGYNSIAFLMPQEAAQLVNAVERRQQEYATGRCCAREALRRLGFPSMPILLRVW